MENYLKKLQNRWGKQQRDAKTMRRVSNGESHIWKWYARSHTDVVAIPVDSERFQLTKIRGKKDDSAIIGELSVNKGFALTANATRFISNKNIAVCLPPDAFSFITTDQNVTEENTQSIFVPYTFDKDEAIIKIREFDINRTHIIYVNRNFVSTILRHLDRVDSLAVLIEPMWFTLARSKDVYDFTTGMDTSSVALSCCFLGEVYELAILNNRGIPLVHGACNPARTSLMDATHQLLYMSKKIYDERLPDIKRAVFLSSVDIQDGQSGSGKEGNTLRDFAARLKKTGTECLSIGFTPAILQGVRNLP